MVLLLLALLEEVMVCGGGGGGGGSVVSVSGLNLNLAKRAERTGKIHPVLRNK